MKVLEFVAGQLVVDQFCLSVCLLGVVSPPTGSNKQHSKAVFFCSCAAHARISNCPHTGSALTRSHARLCQSCLPGHMAGLQSNLQAINNPNLISFD